jgi:predicted MFS family arabinose efflux permease
LFVGGTTQLVQSYRPSERFRAQALNDFSVFSASAAASLLAGVVLYNFGWEVLLISAAPALLLMLAALVWSKSRATS